MLSYKMSYPTFCIIGAGVVGTALAKILVGKPYAFNGVFSRSEKSALACRDFVGQGDVFLEAKELVKKSSIIFITVPDSQIENVCESLATKETLDNKKVVIHMSGALSSDVLSSARDFGASVFSLHPLQSFASVNKAIENLKGSFFGVEGKGTPASEKLIKKLIDQLDGAIISLEPEQKTLYHAAAVVASNYLVTLLDFACKLMEKSGVSKDVAFDMLKPLIYGSLQNIEKMGTPLALTGPISRGDAITIENHIKEIEEKFPEGLSLYKKLGEYTLPLACAKGKITENNANKIKTVLQK